MSIEVENFRQAVEKFDELIIELERIDEKLSSNFSNYETLNNDLHRLESIAKSINLLQTNSVNIISDIHKLNNNVKSLNNDNLLALKEELASFKLELKNIISETINNVDLNQFEKQVENLFRDKINNLSFETEKLNANNTKLKKINEELEYTISRVSSDLKNSISKFNSIAKMVSYTGLSFALFAGVVIGISLFAIFGFNMLKEKMFKDELRAINTYQMKKSELEEVYKNSKKLQKFLNDSGINVSYGYYNGTDIPFIRLKIKQIKPNTEEVSASFERNGYRFIGFKNNLKK